MESRHAGVMKSNRVAQPGMPGEPEPLRARVQEDSLSSDRPPSKTSNRVMPELYAIHIKDTVHTASVDLIVSCYVVLNGDRL